jgi:Icc protein
MANVLQISDTHLRAQANTSDDNDPDACLAASIAGARGIDVDLVLLTGDLTDDGSVAALQRLRNLVGVFAAPVLAVAGNHDILGNVRSVFGDADWAEVGAWQVVAVESLIAGEVHGSIDVDDLLRRLDVLDDRPTVIAIHHPPRSTSTHQWFELIGAEQMLAAARDRPNVRAVVSGHLHQAFHLHDAGLELCGAPSTYYAIEHRGNEWRAVDDGMVGTQLLTLGDDGSFACVPVARSLGC